MAQAVSISLKKFTDSVNAAVKAAVAKHPKFKMEATQGISVSYLIRGIPVPDGVLHTATLAELQAFAGDVAQHVAGAHQELLARGGQAGKLEGAVLSVGGRIIVGIPPIEQSYVITE